jgi:methylenetetrahydrofolate reductase (NADPH)
MLFVNVDGLRRMATINGVRIPEPLDSALDAVHGNPAEVRKLAAEWGSRLTQELLDGGAPGIHFYTLNASRATLDVYASLGLGPSGS